MGNLRNDVLKTKIEFNKAKTKLEMLRIILFSSFYSGSVLLVLILGWIIFPPEQSRWRFISNICFSVLLINLWITYWLIRWIKIVQRIIGELRIKLLQLVWEKVCDCEQACDCALQIENIIKEDNNSLNDEIMTEV